jgi:hypothetical protein
MKKSSIGLSLPNTPLFPLSLSPHDGKQLFWKPGQDCMIMANYLIKLALTIMMNEI